MKKSLASFYCYLLFFASLTSYAQPVIEWNKYFGGDDIEIPFTAIPTSDGGYLIGGRSDSGISGDRTEPTGGETDYWIIKLSANGTKEWDKAFGGDRNDMLEIVQQTPDGGYILVGTSTSDASGDKTEDSNGDVFDGVRIPDCWIVKVSSDGTKEWDRNYGYSDEDLPESVIQTDDGGYIVSCTTFTFKLDTNGDKEWESQYNRLGTDRFGNAKTSDGGYVLGGEAVGGYSLVKLAADGSQQWIRTFQNTSSPLRLIGLKITIASDGGYLIGSASAQAQGGDKTEPSRGGYDYWVTKVAADGTKEWDKTLGGPGKEDLDIMEEVADGGFLVGGRSESEQGGDKSGAKIGAYDCWIVKINADGNMEWDRTLGGPIGPENQGGTLLKLLRQSSDGYILGGFGFGAASEDKTDDFPGYWIIKLATNGSRVWDGTIQAGTSLEACSIPDGFLIYSRSGLQNSQFGVTKVFVEEIALPVTLTTFTAQKEYTTALLTWQTTSETSSDRFEVEHSKNGRSWKHITSTKAQGESSGLHTYQFVHNRPFSGVNYYRLKMIDIDGTFAHSKITSLHFDSDLSISIFPNPAVETLTLQTADWSEVKYVRVTNSQGTLVYESGKIPAQHINTTSFQTGLHFVKITLADGTEAIRKVVIRQ